MATSFDVKLQKIADLSGRVQKYQNRLNVDGQSIADLEKGIRDYETRLKDAKATRARHACRLGVLKSEALTAGLGASSDVSGEPAPDTIMSDSRDEAQSRSSRRTTFGLTNATARTSASFTTSTPKLSSPNHFSSIHDKYPTVIKFQGR
ncbi:hypothetical protein LTR95_008305 [Oleoguttula sp. CCFEE 5521]